VNRFAKFRSGTRKLVTSDATMLAIPGFVVTMGLEYAILRRRGDALVAIGAETDESNVAAPLGYEPKDSAASLAMGAGMLGMGIAASTVINPLDRFLYARRVASVGARRFGFVGAMLVWDFLYYWDHRMSHEHRIFWAQHVNHHSSQRYNLSTALRQSWTSFLMHWVFTPMLVAGFTPKQVARAGELNLLYQYWVHTETVDKLAPSAEYTLSTASHHRVHHGANPQYLDKNYGGILILWDRLFGTFEPEDERVRYGLTKNIRTFNPVKIAYHEWADLLGDMRTATTWRSRFRHAWSPPGWTPNR
jgi:sterol desaturase/sphingolipid hydroxylase (fatty acid hydroxylase superfamily)